MDQRRRNDYDVTDTVKVSSPRAVLDSVCETYSKVYGEIPQAQLTAAFTDFKRLFEGELPGYLGCETVYHDMQHTLDATLAMSRVIAGHEKDVDVESKRLGVTNAVLGVVCALFHDAGYIRRIDEDEGRHGAEFTQSHISRGARFLANYMPTIGLGDLVKPATELIHYTGYERENSSLDLPDQKHVLLGKMLGSADLVAQMADRCYLEKCRDRLYPEFVLGGLAVKKTDEGEAELLFESGIDLLKQTPAFFENVMKNVLDGELDSVYRYLRVWFDGRDPYMESIERNLEHLKEVLARGEWEELRRTPPVFTTDSESVSDTQKLAALKLKQFLG